MNLTSICPTWFSRVMVLFLLVAVAGTDAFAGDMKLEAQLIWGTNDDKSPDPGHKPVKGKILEKLKKLPFNWQNYFEVTRKEFVVSKNGSQAVVLSKDCEIKVRNPEKNMLEVTLLGKGQEIGKIKQPLPKDRLLVIGGNAENFTSWFVVLRQVD
jgi:hypothetical protein